MGKVITFSNQKGGSGKSTLSANLAVLWSNSGYKVAVIDADPQKSLTYWLSERKKYYGDDDIGINFYNFDIRNLTEEVKKIDRAIKAASGASGSKRELIEQALQDPDLTEEQKIEAISNITNS